jgi:hypothetical protein
VIIPGTRMVVFSIRKGSGGSIWTRAGTAFVNKDGSLNVSLDVLPLDGRLHLREAGEKREAAPSVRPAPQQEPLVAAAGGEH